MIDIDKINKVFDDYVNEFDMNNDMIRYKYLHTYRVCAQSKAICKSVGLDEENTSLAYLIALLHDIGRFTQAKEYNSFRDTNTTDHALLGCKILFEEGLIRRFIDDDKYDEIIKKAVFNHNKYSIKGCEGIELMHAKIIRDADKLDIIYSSGLKDSMLIEEDGSKISGQIKVDFENQVLVNLYNGYSKSDLIVAKFAYVYDLNFDYSYRYLKNNNCINKVYDRLVNKDIYKYYVDKVNEYIDGKCNDE